MRTRTTHSSREGFYRLGTVEESGRHFLAVPVSIGVVDLEELYGVTPAEHDGFVADPVAARAFADACRERLHDDRLLRPPGWNRGSPILPPPPGTPLPPPPSSIPWKREGPSSVRADAPPVDAWFGPAAPRSGLDGLGARRDAAATPAEQVAAITELAKLGDLSGRATLLDLLHGGGLDLATALDAQHLLVHLLREQDVADPATFAYLDHHPSEVTDRLVTLSPRLLARSSVDLLVRLWREDDGQPAWTFSVGIGVLVGVDRDGPPRQPTPDLLADHARRVLAATDAAYLSGGEAFAPTTLVERMRRTARGAHERGREHPALHDSTPYVGSLSVWSGLPGPYVKDVELTDGDVAGIERYLADVEALAWRPGRKYFHGHDVDGGPGLRD